MEESKEREKPLSKQEALDLRKKYISPSLSLHYAAYHPLKIIRGEGVFLFDENDQRYLDCINNVAIVGHSHPRVVQAMAAQMEQPEFQIGGNVLNYCVPTNEMLLKYCRRLLSTFPGNKLNTVFFTNSGSEANDLALIMAEAATGHTEIIAVDGAYHGHSAVLMGLSTYKAQQAKVPGAHRPYPNGIIAELPDAFRGRFQDASSAGPLYAEGVKDLIEKAHSQGKKIAAFICEAFFGCAGQVKVPPNYLKSVMEYVHDAGGLCIIDEIQTGFGRAGDFFWVFESQAVVPDIVTIGKPMGNGHPVSAVVTSKAIAIKFAERYGADSLWKYTSDPVSLGVADAVLSVILEEKLQENARVIGGVVMQGLKRLQSKHRVIGDIRGFGLFIGVEIVCGDNPKKPNQSTAKELVKRMLLQHRIMIKEDGIDENIIKIKPPICFTKENANVLLAALDQCLTEMNEK